MRSTISLNHFKNLCLTLFLIPTLSFGQELTGIVIDSESENPLGNVQIILSSGLTNNTDENGIFKLDTPNQKTGVLFHYFGYDDTTILIDKNTTAIDTIILYRSSTTMDEIVVNAKGENYDKNFKGSNFRINATKMQRINPISAEEILKSVPGVNIIGDMGLSNRPNISIRGSWGRRSKKILLLEDGSPIAPAPYIAPGAYYNPVSDRIESIEVYKGADMLKYGPNNMYGAVNYITARPPQSPELRIKLIGGQRNYTTGLVSYGGTWNNLGALVEGVYKSFDGFTDNSSVKVFNLNAKIFSKLSKNQSLYFKVSGQNENNHASLSSLTPFTFAADPTQSPFDADQFTMRRYGLDVVHKWLIRPNIGLTSKVYASDFERDWWKQTTIKVKASDVKAYVGDDTYNTYFNYLNDISFSDEDLVLVGKKNDGIESASDSRWSFTVSGIKEVLKIDWNAFDKVQNFEFGVKLHKEIFKDRTLVSDSSKWARSGTTIADLRYDLWSTSSYIRNKFAFNKFSMTPIVRFEYVNMERQDMLANSLNPNLKNANDFKLTNNYYALLPGITLDYQFKKSELYLSVYRGFIAPSKVFGFLVEENGVITNPNVGEDINMSPEFSFNREVGWRGSLRPHKLNAQIAYYNNTINNFFAAGRNEVFEELAIVNIQGIELALESTIFKNKKQELNVFGNINLLDSKVISGKLWDKELSSTIHSSASANEFIDKVNANRDAYELYSKNISGTYVKLTQEFITEADLNYIDKTVVDLSSEGADNIVVPYAPKVNFSGGMHYSFNKITLGTTINYVAKQFTEFNNFKNESADGSLGELPSYYTLDAFVNYKFSIKGKLKGALFLNGKNITNQIYKASRLNRATSGIFPGGFRQINLGINLIF